MTSKTVQNVSMSTLLHGFHRSCYMSERLMYAGRRHEANVDPRRFHSTISDGMAQSHCILPWLANITTFGATLPQHLQGILNHGRCFTIYRSFNNFKGGANLAIHTWLLSLEQTFKVEGCLPDVLYHQVSITLFEFVDCW